MIFKITIIIQCLDMDVFLYATVAGTLVRRLENFELLHVPCITGRCYNGLLYA